MPAPIARNFATGISAAKAIMSAKIAKYVTAQVAIPTSTDLTKVMIYLSK